MSVDSPEINLLIPGPTPLPPEVRAAMARPMLNHRNEEFGRMLAEVLVGIRRICGTAAPVLPFACSGTGGLEAAVQNVLSPGDRVLGLSCGLFGDRFAAIARAFGADVVVERVEWGRGHDPDDVAAALRRHAGIKAVLVTHNETSTGVANDLEGIAAAAAPSGALVLVDAISSLGALNLQMDAWGLDVVVAGSQKALMGPPGAAFVAVSPRAWEAAGRSATPKFYFSFERARESLSETIAYTPFTPPMPVIYALHVSIAMLFRDGLEARLAHHRRLGRAVRARVAQIGLDMFADPRWVSDTVTAIRVPAGLDVQTMLRRLREERRVILSGGPGGLSGKIFRIGHMGFVQEPQVMAGLSALEEILTEMGLPLSRAPVAPAADHTSPGG